MSDDNLPAPADSGDIQIYPTQDGRAKINVRLDGHSAWLTQAQMAELFESSKQNISQHIRTSADYDKDNDLSQQFFKVVQNKMHWAAHGHTAAEVIHARADATKPDMGLTAKAGRAAHP